jgi:adhesin transport system outer membrane protein
MNLAKYKLIQLKVAINIALAFLFLSCANTVNAESLALDKWLDNDPNVAALLEMHKNKEAKQKLEVRKQLSQLISDAMQINPLTTESDRLVDAATQEVSSAERARMPQISVSGQNTYTQTDEGITSPANMKTGLLAQLQMPLYDSGRIAYSVNSREAQLGNAKAKKKIQQLSLAQELISSCVNYTLQQKLLVVNEIYGGRLKRLSATIDEIANIDSGRASELTQARSRQLQADLSIQTLAGKIEESRADLERLLPNRQVVDCMEALTYFIADSSKITHGFDISDHPQVTSTRLEAESQRAYASQLRATRKPLVQLGVGRSPVNLALSNEYQNSVTVTATFPVFDGNVTDRSADAATQRSMASEARADAIKEKLQSDLKTKSTNVSNAAQRLEKYRALLDVSSKVRADYYIQWSVLGRRSLFELLAIESEQLNLQTNYVSSLFELITSSAFVQIQSGALFKDLNFE